jgi:F-type H+-transporting ATPase subunit b
LRNSIHVTFSNLQARFSAAIFPVVFLTIFASGAAMMPNRLAAQDSAPASVSQPAAAASEAAKPEAGDSEEQQNNAFRLEGPLVKWTAKTFNTSPETAATIFEWANFAVIFFGIGIPLYKFLPKFIRTRGEKVRTDIESARKVTEDANSRLSAVEAKLSKLDDEIAKFRAEVEEEMSRDEARIKASLEEESARIVAAAEQEIGVAAAQAKRGLRHFAADLAIEQAAKQMVLTPQTDKALIAEFVGDVNKGGQN